MTYIKTDPYQQTLSNVFFTELNELILWLTFILKLKTSYFSETV